MYCLATWADQWWEFLALQGKGNWSLSECDPYSVFTDYTVLFCSTTLLLILYNNNTNSWWLCLGLSLLGGIKIEKLSRLCEFNFQTLQSAYIYNSNVWKESEVIKITTIKWQHTYSVETQFLYFFINLFWEISVNLFFFSFWECVRLWANIFSPYN